MDASQGVLCIEGLFVRLLDLTCSCTPWTFHFGELRARSGRPIPIPEPLNPKPSSSALVSAEAADAQHCVACGRGFFKPNIGNEDRHPRVGWRVWGSSGKFGGVLGSWGKFGEVGGSWGLRALWPWLRVQKLLQASRQKRTPPEGGNGKKGYS